MTVAHSIILCEATNTFIVVPFDDAHDTIFRHPDRRLIDAECSWMNSIVEAVAGLEDTDIKATSPHTGLAFYASGPISAEEMIAIEILIKTTSSNI